jgi:hypothetical protein
MNRTWHDEWPSSVVIVSTTLGSCQFVRRTFASRSSSSCTKTAECACHCPSHSLVLSAHHQSNLAKPVDSMGNWKGSLFHCWVDGAKSSCVVVWHVTHWVSLFFYIVDSYVCSTPARSWLMLCCMGLHFHVLKRTRFSVNIFGGVLSTSWIYFLSFC